jgi:long-chain fatty acid transport protein
MKKIALISLITSSVLLAGGYKVPENSTNAVALSAANVAHNQNSADAAYYNPAKMIFMSDENHLDSNLIYIGLEKAEYKGDVSSNGTPLGSHDIESEEENFVVPSLHYVSSKLGKNSARVGVSVVSPGGLSKRWKNSVASMSAEEFTMQTVEVNPTVAFEIEKNLGIAFGFRMVHSSGVADAVPVKDVIYQNMTGDSIDFGYNLALAYQPLEEVEIGITYRSKIDLTLDGDADLKYTDMASGTVVLDGNYDGSVSLPLPASFTIAVAYTLPTKTTIELVYDKTMWSAYKSLNFDYANPTAEAIFGVEHEKNWSDATSYRLGVTQELDALTLMGGFVIDESPVPDSTLGFELPGSDSLSLSFGGRYKLNEKMDIALSALYSMHEDRDVTNDDLDGEFSGANVLFISAGLGYKF